MRFSLADAHPTRLRFLGRFFAVFLALSFLTRSALLFSSSALFAPNLWLIVKIYLVGLVYDVVTMTCFTLVPVLYLIFIPERLYRSRIHRPVTYLFWLAVVSLLTFIHFAEYFFFREFGVRFNFIAVDYLVYTKVVIRNIYESYPLIEICLVICAMTAGIFLLFLKRGIDLSLRTPSRFRRRVLAGLPLLVFPLIATLGIGLFPPKIFSNNYAAELSANGIYNLFAAFQDNQIPYSYFYETRESRRVFQDLRTALEEKGRSAYRNASPYDITREIQSGARGKKWNVVLIVVESLSSEYLGVFGHKGNLTPNLDRLARESLFFTRMYATGTRTDRGLESIVLSIPPTPGRSLVKRPQNEGRFSWGSVMRERGYSTKFVYGGYGYFDNMNYFFRHNGFEIVDRADFAKGEITFENAWGVCDEDLFRKSISEFNRSYQDRKPFFALVLTTSNHRPYTYPEGKIDIPSHTGRDGGVRYTDYALGELLKRSQKEPWFKDTIFLITADHCGDSAGDRDLPANRYEIPLFIYSPDHLSPQRIDKLSSQIDIAPTVLGLLNESYQSKFFGKDIFRTPPDQERAFIGTYQKLGYVKGDNVVVLDVKKERAMYRYDRANGKKATLPVDPRLLEEAITYYQGAYELEQRSLNRWEPMKKDDGGKENSLNSRAKSLLPPERGGGKDFRKNISDG